MPSLNPALEAELQRHGQLLRVLGLALCVGAPITYLVVLVMAAFHGDYHPLLGSWQAVPFRNPLVPALLSAGLLALAGPKIIIGLFQSRIDSAPTFAAALELIRTGTLIACALLETLAIFGLVIGFVVGPDAGPLCLLMLLATPGAYAVLVPGLPVWRTSLEARNWE